MFSSGIKIYHFYYSLDSLAVFNDITTIRRLHPAGITYLHIIAIMCLPSRYLLVLPLLVRNASFSILFILKRTRCALVKVIDAMERAMESVMNASKGIQSLPARITDWLNSYCLVTFFCALFLVFVHVSLSMSFFRITAICLSANSVVENYESKQ